MPTRSSDRFLTVRTEGAILPADLLQRIATGEGGLPGLTPSSYHLIEGEKLNEATNRAWNRLQSAWTSFRAAWDKLSATDPGVGTTRERWLLPLFQEFGYGRLQPLKDAFTVHDKYYPISHVWGHVPIHLVGCRMDLDKRTAGSPSSHSLVQEFLNRSEAHLWGFVSNGLKFRILRDNIRLTRQAYVEFDLQAMFDGKVYADFALLWRLCHQSRVEAGKPQDFWLEQWSKAAQQHGLRVLDQLRGGVEQAIAALGSGFLACPANQRLRDQLHAGKLVAQDYYRQLLRLVYRLLFLFVAEERELLFDPQASDAARERYRRFYSATRLRQQAERMRGTQHTDLYQMLSLVMGSLGSANGCPELGLPALGSFLFSAEAVPDLEACQLANIDLLTAIRALALTSDRHALRPVDYRNLGSEELGSIYESLLELHPVLNSEAGTFQLDTASGHERKTTGSYYTPTSLITCLVDSALNPVLDDAVQQPKSEAALLNLKICDPACGSGHFLIAAAHRLAKRLAVVRTGEEEPPPEAVRAALRDVIGRCIYGVDVNPMAVELCKVALWMEALVPGKPLSFLDHHIQCGNSLIGATPALLAGGIPDMAFEPGEGDDKSYCRRYKLLNQEDRRGQQQMFDEDAPPWERQGNLAAAMIGLESIPDDSVEDVRRRQQRYEELVRSSNYRSGLLLADAWCAAFFWKKRADDSLPYPITEQYYRRIERNPHDITPWMLGEIQRLRGQYRLFHWHLAFPNVFHLPRKGEKPDNPHTGWNGGFDAVIGNPPWVRQELLKPIKKLLQVFASYKSTADSSVFFLERAVQITRPGRRVGLLTPNKWFRADYAEPLRKLLRDRVRVRMLIDFGHAKKLFLDADTFPAAVILELSSQRIGDQEPFRFVRAHDSDRKEHDLDYLIQNRAVTIPHAQLRPDRWELEDPKISVLLNRLRTTGKKLRDHVASPLYRGILTGLNEAFYIDTAARDRLVTEHPGCEPLIKKFLRGRDIQRWLCKWADQWHIVIPSSQNRTWPWSGCKDEAEAEDIFSQTYPSLHAHLKPFEQRLRNREDQGQFWWELRACDYYDLFDQPKIAVQCIAYHSQFALDADRHVLNNKAIFVPTDDLYVLAVLNSRVMWWIVSRVFQHMKDEGLSVDVQFLVDLPIPTPSEELRTSIEVEVDALLQVCRKGTTATDLLNRERKINALVEQAFNLSEVERRLLLDSLPPRDPLLTLEDEVPEEEMRAQPEVSRPQPPAVVAPTRQEIKRLRVISYIILLLRAWNRPVARAALEPAIVLMLNDKARRVILGQLLSGTGKQQLGGRAEYVAGLNGLLDEMRVSQFISGESIRGQQVFRLGAQAPATDMAPSADVQKVKETLQALDKLGEDRALTELEEIVHDTYELVS